MFEVLVYLYETYYRPDACPDSAALAKKLSAVGFEEEEISSALGWLTDLAETTNEMFSQQARQTAFSFGFRVYAEQEYEALGTPSVKSSSNVPAQSTSRLYSSINSKSSF
jgi:Smg protein